MIDINKLLLYIKVSRVTLYKWIKIFNLKKYIIDSDKGNMIDIEGLEVLKANLELLNARDYFTDKRYQIILKLDRLMLTKKYTNIKFIDKKELAKKLGLSLDLLNMLYARSSLSKYHNLKHKMIEVDSFSILMDELVMKLNCRNNDVYRNAITKLKMLMN